MRHCPADRDLKDLEPILMERSNLAPPMTSARDTGPPVKIIVNADDFGISRQVNEAILELVATHCITSTTMIANGPAIEEAARSTGRWPECSFGVHLNLTEFRPLSEKAALLVAQNGEMARLKVEQARPTPRMLQAVYEECSRQIQRLIDLGVPVSHIDSHEHAHTIPQLFPAVKAVQRRFGIRRIRASRNIYRAAEGVSPALLLKKRLFNWGLRTIYSSRITDGFTDLPTLLEMDAEVGRGFRSIEVMVHPGARDREQETAILRSRWTDSLPFGSQLLSYRQL